jgi:membrane protein required for colicin V production
MSLTVLDLVVIVVVLISATLAMVRGFVREVLSVASWLAAVAAAYFFYAPLVPVIRPYIESGTVATIVAAALIFFIALVLASYVTTKISDFVIDSRVGAIDRGLGFIFGAARGVLLVVIALWFFNFLVAKPPDWVANAQTGPVLRDLGDQLVAALPPDIEKWIDERRHGTEEGGATAEQAPAPADDGALDPSDPAYGSGTRQNLDQLILNSDN